jgi:hypothetical protein
MVDDEWLWLGQSYQEKYWGFVSQDRKRVLITGDWLPHFPLTVEGEDKFAAEFELPKFNCPNMKVCNTVQNRDGCKNCQRLFAYCHEFIKARIPDIELIKEL